MVERYDSENTLLKPYRPLRRIACVLCCAAALLPSGVTGQALQRPASPPEMGAHELATAPSIDGDVLGDAAWKGANP
ncbi:MAG: hypothetical protein OEU40_00490, partial [Gammaproteobacteria bacterium]|nr:hypothetical protein [Gammaproteobacteria bacterium]